MKILFQQFDRNRKELMNDFSDVCVIPEVSDGFDASLASDVPGMMPVSLCSEKISFTIYLPRKSYRDIMIVYIR